MTSEELEKYSDLIYSITYYFDGYKNKEDLYQAGCIGLLEARKNFDETLGTKFSTYAYTYILGEMKKLVREDKAVKVSRTLTSLGLKIEKARIILSQKLCRMPTTKELSNFLEIDEKDIIECLKVAPPQSLDEPINMEGKETNLYDVIGDNSMDINTLIALKEELNNLTPFERNIIEKRYMEDLSQSEVAKEMNLSQVKVSREEKKIKKKIKSNLI